MVPGLILVHGYMVNCSFIRNVKFDIKKFQILALATCNAGAIPFLAAKFPDYTCVDDRGRGILEYGMIDLSFFFVFLLVLTMFISSRHVSIVSNYKCLWWFCFSL